MFSQSNLTILTDTQRLHKNDIWCIYLAVPHCFIKVFHLQESQGILGSTIPFTRTKNKAKAISIHLIREKFSFKIIYYLPTRKI